MKIFVCPCCKGKGGYTEAVLDYGQGPYYPCDYCDDEGYVGLRKAFRWWWWVTLENYKRIKNKEEI